MEKFITTDLYLSAFLKTKGFKLTIDKNKNKYQFVFESSESLLTNINEFLTENATCDPLLFTNSIKNLKNLMYNI